MNSWIKSVFRKQEEETDKDKDSLNEEEILDIGDENTGCQGHHFKKNGYVYIQTNTITASSTNRRRTRAEDIPAPNVIIENYFSEAFNFSLKPVLRTKHQHNEVVIEQGVEYVCAHTECEEIKTEWEEVDKKALNWPMYETGDE